ncbi:hypothetical protein BJ170DRAFT_315767 [Xylariales sp. AK1849]|nr:hypothetical protein BJ170DRAFT_315767 [Xylariales sp. AK1849]
MLPEFHYFPRLPPDIQLMIWRLYRASRTGHRHCFSVDGDSVLYAALSKDLMPFDNIVREDELDQWTIADPAAPIEKLRLTGNVSVLSFMTYPGVIWKNTPRSLLSIPGELRCRPVRKRQSASIWVNFKEDLFYFDLPPDQSPVHRWRPSCFRFFHQGKDLVVPRAMSDKHWLFKVQRMAIHILDCHLAEFLEGSNLDLDVLPRLKSLRKLFLAIQVDANKTARCWKAHWRGGANEFIPLDYLEKHHPGVHWSYRAGMNRAVSNAKYLRGESLKAFESNTDSPADVEIVVDVD